MCQQSNDNDRNPTEYKTQDNEKQQSCDTHFPRVDRVLLAMPRVEGGRHVSVMPSNGEKHTGVAKYDYKERNKNVD